MIPNGSYQENAYLMWDDSLKTGTVRSKILTIGALVDPGEEPEKIVDAIEKCNVNISIVLSLRSLTSTLIRYSSPMVIMIIVQESRSC